MLTHAILLVAYTKCLIFFFSLMYIAHNTKLLLGHSSVSFSPKPWEERYGEDVSETGKA